jgi:tRNA pseudouridine65 synthase
MMLEIVYQDEYLIAINKPHGLLVHRSSIAKDVQEFALQKLKKQVGKHVSPVHRLDRKTSGILLFALDKAAEIAMHQKFMNGEVVKEYLAVVRGYSPDEMEINYPLLKENGIQQEAFTAFRTLKRAELDIPLGKHSTSRYSLIEAKPTTGRMHQLRKHFAHIFHPIIGDRKHGCNKQNRFFKDQWGMTTMLLHASKLQFEHPITKHRVYISAKVQDEFSRMMKLMGWEHEMK